MISIIYALNLSDCGTASSLQLTTDLYTPHQDIFFYYDINWYIGLTSQMYISIFYNIIMRMEGQLLIKDEVITFHSEHI